jgi:hypothetical protein
LTGALLLAGLATLAGCSTVESLNPFSSDSGGGAAPASCPTVAILHPLAQTAVFAPGRKPEPIGVAFYGILDDVSSKCDRSGNAIRASLDVVIIGERGPAAGGGSGVDLQYFVAVTGLNQAILSKRSLPVHIAIPTNAKRAGVTDHIEETIPLAGRAPSEINIVLGFQQSPEVVDFYRHFRGR